MITAQTETRPAAAQDAQQVLGDMVFVSLENWDEIWRRNQFFVSEFARRAPECKIIFVGLPNNVTFALRHGRFEVLLRGLLGKGTLTSPPGFPNVYLLNAMKWLPNTLFFGRTFNRWLERRTISRAVKELKIADPVLWLNPEAAVHMVGRMGESVSIYDITDDWTSIKQSEWLRQQIIAEDAELCRRADLVVVCSERLYTMKEHLAKNLLLVHNGVEVERYRLVSHRDSTDPEFAAANVSLPVPMQAQSWPRPVLGYTGTVHPDRMDLNLVAALARKYPAATIPLIGVAHLGPEERVILAGLPNVKLVGPVPYQELQAWMRAFDVCIVPHVVSPFTESLNPLKLFEYLASGLPIVSTDVAGFRDYGDPRATPLVYVARGEAGGERNAAFFRAIDSALAERADPVRFDRMRGLRQQEAAGHRWEQRVDTLVTHILAARKTGRSLKATA